MARGRTRGHKGGRKQFSNPDQIKDDMAKEEEKRLWREQHPDSESESSEEEEQTRNKVIAREWRTYYMYYMFDPQISFKAIISSAQNPLHRYVNKP